MLVIDKGQNKGLLFDRNTGSNLGHPMGFFFCQKFLPPQIFEYCPRRKSSHMMASSHSGFFLFYHYNLQGSCLRTVIQPLTETAGLLISWVFPFLPRTIPTSTDQQGGGLLSDHPHGHNHLYSQSTDWGWFLKDIPTGLNLYQAIVQGLVQDLNVYKIHGVWLSQWNLTTRDAIKMQWGFSFLPPQTNKYSRVLHTRVYFFPDHNIKSLLFPNQKRLGPFPKKGSDSNLGLRVTGGLTVS